MSKILSRDKFLEHTGSMTQPYKKRHDSHLFKLNAPRKDALDAHDAAQREKIERMKGILERAKVGSTARFERAIKAELSRED